MHRRDVQKELAQVGYEEALSYGEAGEKALYWELRNASLRYFKTSEDPSYRKQVFGMASQTNTVDQLCLDAWKMSLGLSQKLGLSGELRVWNQAVRDSFSLAVPNGEGLYAALAMKKGK